MRRYILGQQGLWPGRRWQGKTGTADAIRAVRAVQIDPITVIARSHELTLWGRVADYRPEHLDALMHTERQFFDYGGTLFIYPMSDLPFWRLVMRRRREDERWNTFINANGPLMEEIKAELRARGPLSNRDFTNRSRVEHYRARKDSGLALFALWITGELMSHSRRCWERLYDFRENVAPAELNYEASIQDAEDFFAQEVLNFVGISTAKVWARSFANEIRRPVSAEESQKRLAAMLDAQIIAQVQVEGSKEIHIVNAHHLPILETLEAGNVPAEWQPLDTTTESEAVFLSPLEIVSARGRAKKLFYFEYIWEVYKPANTRRFGYYTLPILYGDTLVARLDPKLDRATKTLIIKGYWPEAEAPINTPEYADALGRGLAHFARFHEVRKLDLTAIQPIALRKHLQRTVKSFS